MSWKMKARKWPSSDPLAPKGRWFKKRLKVCFFIFLMILWVVCVCKIINDGYFNVEWIIGKGKKMLLHHLRKNRDFQKNHQEMYVFSNFKFTFCDGCVSKYINFVYFDVVEVVGKARGKKDPPRKKKLGP
mgnify:CR=1 FL=1